ncbi:MAG: hypothetical protein COV46_06435, partial [Deltaproteobacteria bacterium CG11_big_fil_rev_8_21_14_0_20_49_13]
MSMNDIIKENMFAIADKMARFNALREFIQTLILKFIEENGYSKDLAFVGGTAMRFIYDLQRFSEDLDFSQISQGSFSFEKFTAEVVDHFASIGISAEQKTKAVRNVKIALLKFPGLMLENGLTHRKDQ